MNPSTLGHDGTAAEAILADQQVRELVNEIRENLPPTPPGTPRDRVLAALRDAGLVPIIDALEERVCELQRHFSASSTAAKV